MRRTTLTVLLGMLVVVVGPGAGGSAQRIQAAVVQATASIPADFNDDGFADLAVGVPRENLGAIADAGAVSVLYGSASGLTGTNAQVFTQDSPQVPNFSEADDRFGAVLAAGDFNNDSFQDLAVSAVAEDVGSAVDAGAVTVLLGSASGLSGGGSRLFTQDSPGVGSLAEARDRFGAALAAADLNGDGTTDLAIGVPAEDVGSLPDAGAMTILHGSAGGLTGAGSRLVTQDSPEVPGTAEAGDGFGLALASSGSGGLELVIGIPFEDLGAITGAGAIIIYPARQPDALFTQDSPRIPGVAEPHDHFGWAVATGELQGGANDVAVGVPGEDVGGIRDAGGVNVIYEVEDILGLGNHQLLTQDTYDLPGSAEAADQFGSSLGVGDFNGDGAADLVIGVPFEDVGSGLDAGAVTVLYGEVGRFVFLVGGQSFSQASSDIPGLPERADGFGFQLSTGDFSGDTAADLAIAAPGESLVGTDHAGAVTILGGLEEGGLTSTNPGLFTQDSPGVPDAAESGDGFGTALPAGDTGTPP